MRLSDFDYSLPEECIAQRPAEPRDSSRLLVLNRATGRIQHHIFHQLPRLLSAGDLLVLNETKVIPARLRARKLPGGGAAELLLLEREGPRTWRAMVGGKGLKPGRRLILGSGPQLEIVEDLGGPRRLVRFDQSISGELDRLGETPLPPYIHEPVRSPEEYQTVYARHPGSAAAPTAGLHFTRGTLDELEASGMRLEWITLHIGLDTFLPVSEPDPRRHPIHSEWCHVPQAVVEAVEETKASGRRVIAVGTTSVRALETASRESPGPGLSPFNGRTDLFILPGYEFRVVDAMLTNFHLPRSTLLMMVAAFAGREQILAAYEIARREGYRFYSFGDAMLIA